MANTIQSTLKAALVCSLVLSLSGCGPSASFKADLAKSREFLKEIQANQPPGYSLRVIDKGGAWPDDSGEGQNIKASFTKAAGPVTSITSSATDLNTECQSFIAWAKQFGATGFMNGNDGNNPTLDFKTQSGKAQALCRKTLKIDPSLSNDGSYGSPIFIISGTYPKDGSPVSNWSFEFNHALDKSAKSRSYRHTFAIYVRSTNY
ncbi:MAG: hypothetical protein KGQ38_04895 [Actinomycetales bacterium]|nr:hypothetical protein [Actinomycetales bacterium]